MTHLLGNHRRNLNLAVTLKPVNYETDPRVHFLFVVEPLFKFYELLDDGLTDTYTM